MRGSARVVSALAGALLAVAILLMSGAPAAAFVTQTVRDVLADFSGGTFNRTGLINNPAEGVHGVQLMPIGLTGEWLTDGRRLPMALQEATTSAWGDTIYVAGGRRADGNASSLVYCLRVNEDGSVADIKTGVALPKGLIGASSFVMKTEGPAPKTYLYVIGGLEGGTIISSAVYRAEIDSNTGLTGGWVELDADLPFGLYYSALATHGRYVYLIGGIDYWGQFGTSPNLFRASVSETTGEMTAWTDLFGPNGEPSELPGAFSLGVAAAQALVYAGETHTTIYLIGGRNQPLDQTQSALSAVAVAHIDGTGNLSAWQEPGLDLPVSLHGHGAVMVQGSQVLLAGGMANVNDPQAGIRSNVKAALVDPDNPDFPLVDWDPDPDEWNIWQTGVSFPNGQMRARHGMVQIGTWIYAIGGSDANNTATDTIFRGNLGGVGALYAPTGTYVAPTITVYEGTDPNLAPDLLRLEWEVNLPTGAGGATLGSVVLDYSWRPVNGAWSDWTAVPTSVSGANQYRFDPALPDATQFRYRAHFTSPAPYDRSPRLDMVRLVYDAPPPDLAVGSLTASAGHVRPGNTVTFTAAYKNVGSVAAESVSITATLPPYLSGISPEWIETAAGSHVYVYNVGAVAAGAGGTARITARAEQIPGGVTSLVTTAAASFPPMLDLDGNAAGDPNPGNNMATATIASTPLAVVGTVTSVPASGTNVSPTDPVEYRLSFTLQGDSDTSGLIISVPVDTAKLTDITPLDGGKLEGSTVRWYYMDKVESGFQANVRLQARIRRPLANGTKVSVTFSAASKDLPAGLLGTATHTVVAQPRLTLQGASEPVSGAAVAPGQNIVYRFTALNAGDEAASGATLVATLAPGLTAVSAEPAATMSGGTVSWALGSLGLDSARELKITARVDDNTVHGQTLETVGRLAAGNATATDVRLGHTVRIAARLTVQKLVDPAQGSVPPGGLLGYKLVITNTGGESSEPVVVTDRLPAYTADVDGRTRNSMFTWELGKLAPSQSASVTYRVRVMDPLSETVKSIIGGAAKATTVGSTALSGNTQTPVSHPPNLWVTVTDGKTTVKPGDLLTYTVDYGNRGGPTEGVALQVTLGKGLEWRGGTGWQSEGNGRYRLVIGTLGAQSRRSTFQVAVAADVPADDPLLGLRVDCTIAGAAVDADPHDNRGTDIDIVKGPDLALLSLEVSPTRPLRNQYLTLRVKVGNMGLEGLQPYAVRAGLEQVMVEVYVRPSVSEPPTGPTDSLGGYCPAVGCNPARPAFRQAIPLGDLAPGKTVTLTFPTLLQATTVGVFDLYAQVDVGSSAEHGDFREGNELNNLMALRRFFVAELGPETGTYHLPLLGNNAVSP